MRRIISITARLSLALAAMLVLSSTPYAATPEVARLRDAAKTLRALQTLPDAKVPDKLMSDCRCIAVFPGVLKGAFGWGVRRGHGVISCRDSSRNWSPPSFLTLNGGSFGFQVGFEKTELALFIMTEESARSLISSEFTLGAKVGVAAGPVGRSVEGATDLKLDAEIYSYARSKGLFAGISLEGARIGPDRSAIHMFYEEDVRPEQILFERRVPREPRAVAEFTSALPE